MKKILFLIAALCACTLSTFAHDFYVNGIYYNILGGDSVEVTYQGDYNNGWSNYYGSVTIPEKVDYNGTTYRVTAIGSRAFYINTYNSTSSITSITIPESVTAIGSEAFSGCSNLTRVTIPNSVTTIGSSAFSGCSSLTSITIPEGITSISYNTFWGCSSLTAITIPESVTSISGGAFANTGIKSITISNSVCELVGTGGSTGVFYNCKNLTSITIGNGQISISGETFAHCPNVKSIIVLDGNPLYKSVNNCLITKRTKQLILGCKSSIIPTDGSVTTIGDYAFCGARNTSLNIPTTITAIGKYAFSGSYLKNMTLPNSITAISEYTFFDCDSLATITLPSSLTTIGESAFAYCDTLATLTIPNSVTTIGKYAFSNSGLTSIAIPNNVRTIDEYVFSYCRKLISITIPSSIYSIYQGAFSVCDALEKVNYLGTIDSWCSLFPYKSYDYDASNPLHNGADFYLNDVKVTELTLPQKTREWTVGKSFKGCTSLQSVTIPSSVSSISESAFEGCTNLQSAIIKRTTPPSIESNAFPSTTHIIVPCGSSEAYWADTEWAKYFYFEEEVVFDWNVKSADESKGTATIVQGPASCDNPEAIIQATPAAGYKFEKWHDGNTENPRTLTISEDTTYTAYFINDNAFIHVSAVTLNETNVDLKIGQSYQLIATVTPANASNSTISWSSSHPEVATVSANGLIEAVGQGATTITVITEDGSKIATCKVNVTATITALNLRVDHIALYPNETYSLNTVVTPANADRSTLVWSSSDKNIATVDATGFVTAHAVGKATITVATDDNTLSASCQLTVVDTDLASNVLVETTDNSALFTWTTVAEAFKYQFSIYADDARTDLICKLTCNAWGQLIGVSFPHKKAAAEQPTSGTLLQFVVDGLASGTTYSFTLNGYTESEEEVLAKAGQFTTTGSAVTGVETPYIASPDGVHKLLENGTIYILRNGEKYTIDGRRIM